MKNILNINDIDYLIELVALDKTFHEMDLAFKKESEKNYIEKNYVNKKNQIKTDKKLLIKLLKIKKQMKVLK